MLPVPAKGEFVLKNSLKRILVLCIAAVLLTASAANFSAATIYIQDGYSFTDLDANTISLCGWDNRSPDLVIPNKLGDYYFAEVADFGLRGNTGITSLDLSQATNFRRLGVYSFADCSELSGEVVLPLRITDLGRSSFENCYQLQSVVIYANIDTINSQCFYNCYSLSNVILPSDLKKIDSLAFANCSALNSILIPSSVKEISSSAFKDDYNLVIYCYTDSYAHQYAEENRIAHVLIDGDKIGDVNGDGVVDILDATEIQKYAAESTDFTDEQFELGDINKDGYCDVIDALLVQKSVIGAYELPQNIIRY